MENLKIEEVKIDYLNSLNRNFKYHSVDKILKIECLECSSIFYQDMYYHLHGGNCLMCSIKNILNVVNSE